MSSDRLSKWDLREEMIEMAAKCVGLKENSAKQKARELFKKYKDAIASQPDVDFYKDLCNRSEKILRIISSGTISFVTDQGSGLILVKDISEIQEREDKNIVVIMKTGRSHLFSNKFEYIKEALSYIKH